MTNSTKSIIKGMGAVMAVGSAAAFIGSSLMDSTSKTKKKIKKTADKAVKTMNAVIDSVSDMF